MLQRHLDKYTSLYKFLNMKHFLILLCLLSITSISIGQNECPPKATPTVGVGSTTVLPSNPPDNPKHPRQAPEVPDKRLIFFPPGLGGNTTSWERAASATEYQAPGQTIPGFPARKAKAIRSTYAQFSLSGAAQTFHHHLVSVGDPLCTAYGITDKSINFIVAHSQGGIVSRATDQMYDELGEPEQRRFGGIATFGTSHLGAQILNNKDQFDAFATDAINSLGAGPINDTIQNNAFIDFFVPNDKIENIRHRLGEIFGEKIAPIMYKSQNQNITEDYKVGAAPLNALNGYTSTLPRVAFYGVETEPVFYRTIYSMSIKSPNDFPPFGADPDDYLVNQISAMRDKYKAKYELYKARVEYLESIGLPCGPLKWLCCYPYCIIWDTEYWQKKSKRNDWKKGIDWIDASNTKYKTILGAAGTTTQTISYNYCQSSTGQTFPAQGGTCPPGTTQYSGTQTQTWPWSKDSDGTVLVESQVGFAGAVVASMPGSNHLQMRNDSNTKGRLNELYNGIYGAYFTTAPQ
jgi:pimeloyl-ACP methyl ester carboxylesterase